MNRVYQGASLVFLALAAYVGTTSVWTLRFYDRLGPGPGFFPFWLSVALGGLALAMLYTATFGPPEPLPPDFIPERAGALRIAAILVTVGAAVLVLEPLGFRLTMFVLIGVLLYAFGGRNILLNVVIAAAGSFGVFAVFVRLLKVQLPVGLLGI